MIYNERQFKITSKQIEKLSLSIQSVDHKSIPEWLAKAQLEALQSQIVDLKAQILEYNLIKEGHVHYTECSDLSTLPKILIQSRIAKGLSQKELGEALGLSMQQIQRYEATHYMGASLARLINISEILEITLTEIWGGGESSSNDAIFIWQDIDAVNWSKFPAKEMIKRGWLALEHKISPVKAIQNFFTQAAGPNFASALHRKKFHGENKPNEYSLLAWQAKILEKARIKFDNQNISEFDYNDSWVPDLVKLSIRDDGPAAAQAFLASKGIILVIEKHLEGTYLDGAAMLLETGNPVIGLTLRFDRLDNFWFVLFHELGHVFLHVFESLNMDFFDEEGGDGNDEIEIEADKFALDFLIPKEEWDSCISRFMMNNESVEADAINLKIHPSIIAGRLRKEFDNFTVFNKLIGQGLVRHQFGEEL